MLFKDKIRKLKLHCESEFELLKNRTLCFTGHRPQKLPWRENEDDERCEIVKKTLREKIIEAIKNGYVYFISGLALGFDIISAEMVLELKKDYPHIKLIGAIPCKDQYKVWKPYQIKRYNEVLSKCDSVRCLYDMYNDKCMLERNDYMLNNSSLVIALYDGRGGGTGYTIKKAKGKGLKVEIIDLNIIRI